MAWNWEWSASPKDLCVCFLCTFGYSPVGISMTVSKYLFFHWHVNKWYQTFLSSLYFQVVWRPPPWHQAQGAPLPVWLHWRVQFTVRGLFPLPLLCLHVPCHHLRRTSGRGNRRTHSKSLSPSLWMLTVFRRDWLCSAANLRPDNSSTMVRISLINHPSIISPSVFPQSAIESLFGASLTGIAYSLFAGQPLTILGSTGPVLVFEKILFKFCKYALFFFSCDRTCESSSTSCSFNLHMMHNVMITLMGVGSMDAGGPNIWPPIDH